LAVRTIVVGLGSRKKRVEEEEEDEIMSYSKLTILPFHVEIIKGYTSIH
jgi:hypothetical protein